MQRYALRRALSVAFIVVGLCVLIGAAIFDIALPMAVNTIILVLVVVSAVGLVRLREEQEEYQDILAGVAEDTDTQHAPESQDDKTPHPTA